MYHTIVEDIENLIKEERSKNNSSK
jgi:hypothetical protein